MAVEAQSSGLRPGERMPRFRLPAHDGSVVDSRELAGRPYVLFMYRRASTPVCINESAAFAELYPQFREAGAEVFGASADGYQAQTNFVCRFALPFKLLTDHDWQLRRQLGTPVPVEKEKKRITFVVDAEGLIRLIYFYERRGDVRDHARLALATVRELAGLPPQEYA
jgi:peroxiredoxin Q/BCP